MTDASTFPPNRPAFEPLEPRLLLSAGVVDVGIVNLHAVDIAQAANHVSRAHRAAISPDWAEPNDSRAAAYNLGAVEGLKDWTGLSIHRKNNADWFKFTFSTAGGPKDYVKTTFSDAKGDIDMSLYDADGSWLDTSNGVDDVEQLSLDGYAPGTYYVKVYGYAGATNPSYAIQISAAAGATTPDRFEPNDTRAAATDLGALTGDGYRWDDLSIHKTSDEDWLKFTTSQAGAAGDEVRIEFPAGGQSANLALYDSAGNLLQSATTGTGSRSVSLAGQPAGTYYIRVYGTASAMYSLVVNAPAASGTASRDWTILAYVDGDNNLEEYAIDDVNEMEAAVLPPDVTVAVELDRTPGYDTSNGNWTDTRRGVITHDTNTSIISSSLGSIGEKNMGDPGTLKDFITWGVSHYPAEHYALVLWDHGGGLEGVSWDDTSHGDNLTVAELSTAIAGAGTHMDVVAFDACEMGMAEVAYNLRNVTDVVVASEETVPGDGFDYTDLLKRVAANPAMNAEQMGSTMVTSYAAEYGSRETLSATRTSAYANLATALTGFSDAVLAGATAKDWSYIISARNSTPYFTETDYRDLRTFMSRLAALAVSAPIKTAAQNVVTAVNATIIANHSGSREAGTGLSINLPSGSWGAASLASYTPAAFDLVANTHWRNFLQAFTARA